MNKENYLCLFLCLFFRVVSSAQNEASPANPAPGADTAETTFVLTSGTNHALRPYIRILPDTAAGYGIADILQPRLQAGFRPYSELAGSVVSDRYYWGRLQLENRLPAAADNLEWVLNFSGTFTRIEVFTRDSAGNWTAQVNGSFLPAARKKFVPTRSGNWVKIVLPPHRPVTVYFRGISERVAMPPSFHAFIQPVSVFYDKLVAGKTMNALFTGFLLMMLLYNLIQFFIVRDRNYFYYSGYLLMVMIYAAYIADDLEDWLGGLDATGHHGYYSLFKVCIYLGLMGWLAFIRSFLDLRQLLPGWDRYFRYLMWLGLPAMAFFVFLAFRYNFSYEIDDRVTVSYITVVTVSGFVFTYFLYRSKDPKGHFITAGILVISLGFLLTLFSRVYQTAFTVDFLKICTVLEILIFSMGLAYRQRQQEEARRLADFALKESRLIQEKKQLEARRLQELDQFKSRFFTNITHEFRTPLTVILGMSERVLGEAVTQSHPLAIAQPVTLIQRNGENLLRLINQIMDLAKLESNTLKMNYIQGDILAFTRYIAESLHSLANAHNLLLRVESEHAAIVMDYDPERFLQIVHNLLSNAVKFTPSGGKVVLRTKLEGPWLHLSVSDTGAGISPEELPQVFERFFQAGNQEHARAGGAGIGLSLTRELVRAMGGEITVESTPGQGTTFSVKLPVSNNAVPEVRGIQKIPSAPGLSLPLHATTRTDRPNILIVEDNPDVVEYLNACLKDLYHLDFAYNGQAGIEKALENTPDLLVSDVMMPFKDGFEVLDALKNDERTSHIPVILLTARADVQSRLTGLRSGADAYLSKPFHQEELLVTVENLLETRQKLQFKYQQQVLAAETPAAATEIEDIFLQKVRGIIEAHYASDDFGLPQLCQKIGMSRSQLFRKMKALTDIAPSDLIRLHRLNRAKTLLESGSVNVAEAAWQTGFKDPSYFSKLYQEEFGEAPSATRK